MKFKIPRSSLYFNIAMVLAMAAVSLWSGCEKRPVGVTKLSSRAASVGGGNLPRGGMPGAGLAEPSQAPVSESAGFDELWVIARASDSEAQPTADSPGTGALMAEIEQKEVPMPLKHTDVHASVSCYIGSVEVVQQFLNPYSGKIEAVYVFPLPHNAAVNEFIMTIGERRIRGIIRERQEAEQIYQEAKRQGYVASLLTEERPNVFKQSVANIEPGKEIDVTMRYFQTLEYADGWYEFVFPMVIGPRFNPPGTTNGIGAAARGAAGVSGQKTEVQYLKPGERSGHDISLKLDVDAGVAIEEFRCATHDVTHESPSPERLSVTLKPGDSIPNRDFVLRYRVAGEKIKSDLLTYRDQRGGYFTLMLYPPKELKNLARQPLELVFVLDCSGSMSGRPVAQAKAAVARGLSLLRPGDSFQIISFSITASQLGPTPLEATPENIRRGLNYLHGLEGEGGTMMIEGIKAALDFPHDPERLRFVCFLTDGYIGNEAEILGEIHKRLGASRIFSFGIGSSVNRYLIDHMAGEGRGAVAYLGSRDNAATIMEDFFERISHPGLTDVTIDWGGMQVRDVYPREVPDLFVGRPVILTGRFQGDTGAPIQISGKVAGESPQFSVPASAVEDNATHHGLPSIWARMKIADLAAQSIYEPSATVPEQIRQVALDYGLMSEFTAFVAVDSTRQTEGAEGTTVPVAVPVPEGVKYDTTVPEKSGN
jgi:Ca-activated chloride channel family protein